MKASTSLVEWWDITIRELGLRDSYTEGPPEIIEAKITGKEVVVSAEEEKPVVDIMTALKQSIEKTKASKKPMEKAKGERKEAAEVLPAKQRKQKVA